jgi:hypothetical protein
MTGYKYTIITSSSSSTSSPIYFYWVDISISSKKTQFFKKGDFDLDFFEGGGHRSLKCALVSYFYALFQVLDGFLVVDLILMMRGERKEKIFIVLIQCGLDLDACVRARSSS